MSSKLYSVSTWRLDPSPSAQVLFWVLAVVLGAGGLCEVISINYVARI